MKGGATSAVAAVKDSASTAVAAVKDGAANAAGAVKESASAVARRTADTIEDAPLAVIAGGLAIGVLAGALLPRTEREARVLGPVGRRVKEGAALAARAARDAGVAELANHGISRDAARDQAKKLFEQVVSAAKSAGTAAAQAGRDGARQGFKDQD
ncbi:MAG: hypothetical protein A4S12_05185 [Proteobacteria bacterium SG_bin5]|nr:MAG: hypothetical protein A4S12_05185 [Proteobacteria bacterium SG_bin5]